MFKGLRRIGGSTTDPTTNTTSKLLFVPTLTYKVENYINNVSMSTRGRKQLEVAYNYYCSCREAIE